MSRNAGAVIRRPVSVPAPTPGKLRLRAGALSAGAVATGALAIGALALGAVAVGRAAVGRLAIGDLMLCRGRARRGEIQVLVIEELTIGRLHVRSFDRERSGDVITSARRPEGRDNVP